MRTHTFSPDPMLPDENQPANSLANSDNALRLVSSPTACTETDNSTGVGTSQPAASSKEPGILHRHYLTFD
jgi:hypothetical protein